MVAVTRGTCPTTRVVWPCPVRSSAIFTSPGPRWWIVPSPKPISASPDKVMMYCRRGAVCQSLKEPGGVERNTTPFAPWSAVNSGCDARSSSSMCDSPSSPEYKRKIPIQDSPQAAVVRPRLASASRRWRWRWRAILHHGEVACHALVLRTRGGALPLFFLLNLSQTPVFRQEDPQRVGGVCATCLRGLGLPPSGRGEGHHLAPRPRSLHQKLPAQFIGLCSRLK